MGRFYKIVYGDYLQRTRSYAFLITLAASLYAAYAFVPAHDANYTTLRIGNYIGVSNSAWTGYVTAMMTSVFLSIIGFYLINSNIKKDIDTGVGMIIATTSITNLRYLLAKTVSNFMLLFTITAIICMMSIAVFLIRPGNYHFEILNFITPFLIITLPSLFLISSLAVFAEIVCYRYTVIMNIGYFILLIALLPSAQPISPVFDVLGVKTITTGMEQLVINKFHLAEAKTGMGFHIGNKGHIRLFEFEGLRWSAFYMLSRLLWIGIGFGLTYFSSLLFHRFDVTERVNKQKKQKPLSAETIQAPTAKTLKEIRLGTLPKIKPSFGIGLLIKTELLMLYRKGPKWLWLFNLGGMIALALAPVNIAHLMILPCLWFLQIGRWSDLATKEKTNRIHYFTYASYKPLSRLFSAQLLAGIIISVGLSSPLLLRYSIAMEPLPIISIFLGAIFIVVFAIFLGVISGGKKLFEILFFFLAYSNINKIPVLDYFGALNKGTNYMVMMAVLSLSITAISYIWRRFEISRL